MKAYLLKYTEQIWGLQIWMSGIKLGAIETVCVCLISKIILVCARLLYISSNLVTLFLLGNPFVIHKCVWLLS